MARLQPCPITLPEYCRYSPSARRVLVEPGIDYDEFRCHAGFHHGLPAVFEGDLALCLASCNGDHQTNAAGLWGALDKKRPALSN